LLPCPFCGGAPRIRSGRVCEDSEEVYVECDSCIVRTDPVEAPFAGQVRHLAIAAWNRRSHTVQVVGTGLAISTIDASPQLGVAGRTRADRTAGNPNERRGKLEQERDDASRIADQNYESAARTVKTVASLEAEVARLREVLRHAGGAIGTLDPDTLGRDLRDGHTYRDELLANIDAALSAGSETPQ
jgi:Lar family restriction alleviation protein